MNLTDQQQEALLNYEDLKLQIKELEDELEPLRDIIFPIMQKDVDLQCEKGFLRLKERANWKFSSTVMEKEKEVKTLKNDEIAKGIAQNNPTIYIEYSVTKGE